MAMEKEKLQDLEEQMANTRIYAPANGTVVYFTERYYRDFGPIMKGAKVHKGRNIMKILNSNKMMVDLNVPQSMRAYLRQGQKAVVTCVDTKIETTLSYISSTMDSNRRGQIDKSYFRGEIQITNPPETLFEGMSVLVEIPTGLPPTRN
jgi:multidrug efflux pump subunit AcrA (membrane-fusion protein)